jgi:hypothetical protein
MKLKKITAEAALAGAIGFAALGAAAGLANADPMWPVPPPPPVPAPMWAPPAPPPPPWAPFAQVVWNPDVQGWGVWVNGGFTPL